METPSHTLANLFQQLGLDASDEAIDAFIASHKLAANTKLESAPFWTEAQQQFLLESRANDADWVALVDELDELLRD